LVSQSSANLTGFLGSFVATNVPIRQKYNTFCSRGKGVYMSKIYQESLTFFSESLTPIKEGKRIRYYLGEKYPEIYFTSQEAKCMFYCLNRLSSKKTSQLMKINFRTVEYYRENMREKVGATSKRDLIAKIKETHFMNYMPYLEEICLILVAGSTG
jgi:DNA-binding CsgD family transcriptional regulator